MSITPKQTETHPLLGNSLKLDSRAACVFELRQHSQKSLSRERRKIIKKKFGMFRLLFAT